MTTAFTSIRERRLWAWALAVTVAIYSTLGLARSLAGELRDRNLLDTSFVLGFLVLGGVVVVLAVKTRARGAEIVVAVGVAAVYLMAFARMGIPEERTHLFEYSLLAVLVYQALLERRANGGRVWPPALLAVMVTALLGWLDEGIQWILPNRVYDLRDVGFNALAGLLAVTASVVLGWARRGSRSRRCQG